VRAQERVSALGSPYAPDHARAQLVKIAGWFLKARRGASILLAHAAVFERVLAGDFFDTMADITRAVTPIAEAGVKGHIVQWWTRLRKPFPMRAASNSMKWRGRSNSCLPRPRRCAKPMRKSSQAIAQACAISAQDRMELLDPPYR